MPETIDLKINGVLISMPAGSMVAAAVLKAGVASFRRSVTGEPRAPLCGMGICFECQVTINGQSKRRSCQTLCQSGMDVRTDE